MYLEKDCAQKPFSFKFCIIFLGSCWNEVAFAGVTGTFCFRLGMPMDFMCSVTVTDERKYNGASKREARQANKLQVLYLCLQVIAWSCDYFPL